LRRCLPDVDSFKLEILRERYSINNPSHSAKGDVLTVIDLLKNHAGPRLKKHGIFTFEELLNFSKETPIWGCRKRLGLKPLVDPKPTADEILEVLAITQNGETLKDKDIAIIDSWIGSLQPKPRGGQKNIENNLKEIVAEGKLSQEEKMEVLELIQPWLPIDEEEMEIQKALEKKHSKETNPPSKTSTKEKPATKRQLNYLKILGGDTSKPMSKLTASKQIDSLKAQIQEKKHKVQNKTSQKTTVEIQ
jgi:DNA polymerase III epsilon subunit-like protein